MGKIGMCPCWTATVETSRCLTAQTSPFDVWGMSCFVNLAYCTLEPQGHRLVSLVPSAMETQTQHSLCQSDGLFKAQDLKLDPVKKSRVSRELVLEVVEVVTDSSLLSQWTWRDVTDHVFTVARATWTLLILWAALCSPCSAALIS